MYCPKCGSEIPDGSEFCNKCGIKIEKQTIDNNDIKLAWEKDKDSKSEDNSSKDVTKVINTSQRKSSNHFGCTIFVVVLIIVIGVIIGVVANTHKDVKSMVWVDAEDAVKLELKAPSTAKFPWFDESYITDNGDGTYIVSAYVDADNSFGAKIRNNFSCKVSNEDGSGNGEVTNIFYDDYS